MEFKKISLEKRQRRTPQQAGGACEAPPHGDVIISFRSIP
jgi:hypothetical protein